MDLDLDSERERSIEDNNELKNNGKTMDDVRDEGTAGKSKGRGLRKWRRIRRESGKETSSNFDSNRKRGIVALPGENKLISEGSSSSTNAVSIAFGNALDHVPFYGLDLPSMADSENSRSSTAASAPRTTLSVNEFSTVGLGIDRNTKATSLTAVNSGQREKGRNVKKKARGGKIKKENSISSLESDSRSNSVFLQGVNANSLMRNDSDDV